MEEINIYCDESCHLEHDNIPVMGLGAIWLPKKDVKQISKQIISIKKKHGLKSYEEIKWTNISNCNYELYKEIVEYFFSVESLNYRGIVADKTKLNHSAYNQTHNDWYDKMYFYLLRNILDSRNKHNIYVDIKDHHSYEKCQKILDICCNNYYDFSHESINKIQPIRSYESQLVQLADILTGAICYRNRFGCSNAYRSQAKVSIIRDIIRLSGKQLNKKTVPGEKKFNLFFWEGQQ